MQGFSVMYRNPGHWDIYTSNERVFCIRGDIGHIVIRDERKIGRVEHPRFKTVQMAFAYIAEILMFEPLAVDGVSMVDSDGNKLVAIKE